MNDTWKWNLTCFFAIATWQSSSSFYCRRLTDTDSDYCSDWVSTQCNSSIVNAIGTCFIAYFQAFWHSFVFFQHISHLKDHFLCLNACREAAEYTECLQHDINMHKKRVPHADSWVRIGWHSAEDKNARHVVREKSVLKSIQCLLLVCSLIHSFAFPFEVLQSSSVHAMYVSLCLQLSHKVLRFFTLAPPAYPFLPSMPSLLSFEISADEPSFCCCYCPLHVTCLCLFCLT